jgi:tRNA pseudouridine38-40 synthase
VRYRLDLSYNGSNYHGWQRQENAISVQQIIEAQLEILCQDKVEITGCGRTDTGVHARSYVAHFDMEKALPDNFCYRLNGMLPVDIAVSNIIAASPDFHARFSAIKREYKYYIHFQKNPFLHGTSWLRRGNVDFEKMNEAASILVGTKSFMCFCKGETPNGSYTCSVYHAAWKWDENGAVFSIEADRFLRNMVRAIVGTLIDIGNEKMDLNAFRELLQNGTRSDAGNSVPAHGLFLENIVYP